ncbi:putative type III effector protein [Xanthomonas translucens pv. poae]|uniref:Putative type III effector protein n=2 Tax=Xanthomonas translucens group TaxID=3390202 RepID=A0A0K2ZIX9_9XANT|nr:XopX family type III secretion system effector [Xanthomonas translucens]UKE62064.1 type III secretion system effector protein [Xanthomonas translucens pv. poae]CTP85573.1 putative type III effector protein [Xanthomonas translucens pv. poae]
MRSSATDDLLLESQPRSLEVAADTSAPATLATRASAVLTSGVKRASTALSTAASNLWSISDLRTMLQMHANDPEFLAVMKGADPERMAPHTLSSCRQQMRELSELIKHAEGLGAHQRKQLLGDIKAVMDAMQPLDHATPVTSRVLKSIANLVNFWPVVVPSPLMGKQAKTFAFTMSTATKGVLALSASALRPTADGLPFPLAGGQLGREANEGHLYNVLINTLFLATELPKKFGDPALRKQAEAVSNNMGYGAGLSVTFTAIMLTPFLWNSLSKLGNTMLDKGARLGAATADAVGLKNQAQQLRARLTPAQINDVVRNQLLQIRGQLDAASDAFQQARRNFIGEDGGKELTRTVNMQCTHLLETLDACSKRLASVLQLDGNQTPSLPREIRNQDFSSKLALTLLATAVTGSTIYLVQPDRLGTINLLSDTCIVTAVMGQSAWNKQATRQDAMERFKGMCGGSMVIALALGAEKLSKTFADKSLIDSSPNSQFYAGVIMSLMAVTMPGPIARSAEMAMKMAGSGMSMAGSGLKRLFTGPDGTPLATGAPGSPEEMQEHLESTARYLEDLSPEEQDAYASMVGEIAAQAVQDAGAQAQVPHSSVTITEIEDDDQPAAPEQVAASSANRPRAD